MKELQLEDIYIYLIERTERCMKKYAQAKFKEEGINVTSDQWLILKRLSEYKVINQRELAALAFKDPASVTRMLDILQKKELITREAVANDRRAYNVSLTEQGEALVQKVLPIAKAIRAKGMEQVSEEEQESLKRILNKIYHNFQP